MKPSAELSLDSKSVRIDIYVRGGEEFSHSFFQISKQDAEQLAKDILNLTQKKDENKIYNDESPA